MVVCPHYMLIAAKQTVYIVPASLAPTHHGFISCVLCQSLGGTPMGKGFARERSTAHELQPVVTLITLGNYQSTHVWKLTRLLHQLGAFIGSTSQGCNTMEHSSKWSRYLYQMW